MSNKPVLFGTRWEAKKVILSILWGIHPRPYRLMFAILTTFRKERWGIIERGFDIHVRRQLPWEEL